MKFRVTRGAGGIVGDQSDAPGHPLRRRQQPINTKLNPAHPFFFFFAAGKFSGGFGNRAFNSAICFAN